MNLFITTEHFAEDYSFGMALFDLVPVICFAIAGFFLIKDLYNKLVKGNYALLSAGIMMIALCGLLKALWKMLVALNVCDWLELNIMFFPTQTFGFVFYAAGLIGILYSKKMKEQQTKTMAIAPIFALPLLLTTLTSAPVETFKKGSLVFIILIVLAAAAATAMLIYVSVRLHSWPAVILFALSLVCMMMMGYLGGDSAAAKLGETTANWIEESVNSAGQAMVLAGVLILHKKGLATTELF